MMEKVNLSEKLSLFREHRSPKIAGEVNDSFVRLVKFQGPFLWHKHEILKRRIEQNSLPARDVSQSEVFQFKTSKNRLQQNET